MGHVNTVFIQKHLLQRNLLKWYDKHARDLPWRRTRDPYKIWISEIMLQQTQVDTVIPYYEKWIRRFPTIMSLAHAKLDDVLKLWAGLGYYRRARGLHQAAQQIQSEFGGQLPRQTDRLMRLPGIGRYTAGAIASIAFDQKAPVMDGNVLRVLTRVIACTDSVDEGKTLSRLWDISESLLPNKKTGDFNQALMELGATICWPENPQCPACPISLLCRAHKEGRTTFYPVRKKKTKIQKIASAALILRNRGKVFVTQQPKEDRWGGLWMFPHSHKIRPLCSRFGLKTKDLKHRMTLHHGFTKYQVRLKVFEGSLPLPDSFSSPIQGQWVRMKDLKRLAFPSPHQKIVQELVKNNG